MSASPGQPLADAFGPTFGCPTAPLISCRLRCFLGVSTAPVLPLVNPLLLGKAGTQYGPFCSQTLRESPFFGFVVCDPGPSYALIACLSYAASVATPTTATASLCVTKTIPPLTALLLRWLVAASSLSWHVSKPSPTSSLNSRFLIQPMSQPYPPLSSMWSRPSYTLVASPDDAPQYFCPYHCHGPSWCSIEAGQAVGVSSAFLGCPQVQICLWSIHCSLEQPIFGLPLFSAWSWPILYLDRQACQCTLCCNPYHCRSLSWFSSESVPPLAALLPP